MPYYYSYQHDNEPKLSCYVNIEGEFIKNDEMKCTQCAAINMNGTRCKKSACLFGDFCTLHMKTKKNLQLKKSDNGYGIFVWKNPYNKDDVIVEYKRESTEKKSCYPPYHIVKNSLVFDFQCKQRNIIANINRDSQKKNTYIKIVSDSNNNYKIQLVASEYIETGRELVLPNDTHTVCGSHKTRYVSIPRF